MAAGGFGTEAALSLEGERLGHFQLEELIGGGGMGVVYRALDTMLGRTVALKVLSNDTTDEETLRRFRNEAQSAARLDHPNIARVYYVGEDKGWNYIAFEYIEGVNVRDLVQRTGPLSVDDAVSYTLQVAEALEHAAQRDVVHRDIKPSNILVMPDGKAKLVDMGLARLHQVEAPSTDLTATGVTLGTFDYISPEQARDPRTADVRSDLYSLGCTFYYMLTGVPPFPEGTVLQKLLSHSSEAPPDPRDVRDDIPDEVAQIVLRLMAKQPGQRYQRPNELVGELLLLAERMGLSVARQGATVWIASRASRWSRWERHLPWIVPVLLLLAGVFTLEWLNRPDVIDRAMMEPRIERPSVPGEADTPRQAFPPEGTPTTEPFVDDVSRPAEQPTSPSASRDREDDTEEEPPLVSPDRPELETERLNGESASIGDPLFGLSERQPSELPFDEPAAAVGPSPADESPVDEGVATDEPPSMIRVDPAAADGTDPMVVGSLEEALSIASSTEAVDQIQLAVDAVDVAPLRIRLDEYRRPLTVQAAPGYTPVLRFLPPRESMSLEESLLDLSGGRVRWQGIHFHVSLPFGLVERWAFFRINSAADLQLANCSITLANPNHAQSAFFHVHADLAATAPASGFPIAERTTPKVTLDACVLRGQAEVVRADEGIPFWISWDQGFLATDRVFAACEGIAESAGDKVIRISLNHVTAYARQGLVTMELTEQAEVMPELLVVANHTVVVHDRDRPLVTYRGVADIDEVIGMFEMSGADNLYDSTDLRWRITTRGGETRDFHWDDDGRPWYLERRAERSVRWQRPLPERPDVSRLRPEDFLLEKSVSLVAGFSLDQLPVPRDPPATMGQTTGDIAPADDDPVRR